MSTKLTITVPKILHRTGLWRIALLLLTVCTGFVCPKAQPVQPKVDIQLLGPDQGLPDRNVRCVVQDSLGFLWIGTSADLWRFDGYSFFNHTSLISSGSGAITLIDDIVLSPDKQVWVAHSNGLTIIDPRTLQSRSLDATHFFPGKITSRQIARIHFDKDSAAWLSMLGNMLVKLDKNVKPLLLFQVPKRQNDDIQSKRAVFDILQDYSNEKLYLYSKDNYIDIIDKKGNYLGGIELRDKIVPKGFFANYIIPSSHESIMVYYTTLNNQQHLVREYSFHHGTFLSPAAQAKGVYRGAPFYDRNGFIWYRGEREIGFLNTKTQTFTDLTAQIQEKVGAETYFYKSMVSSDNTFWLCSNAGLFKITISEQFFQTYLSIPLQKPTDVGTSMRGITEDSSGYLWFCSYGFKKGNQTYLVHRLDPGTDSIQHMPVRILKDTTRTASTSSYILYKGLFANGAMYAITDGTSLLRLKSSGAVLTGNAYHNISVNELSSIYCLNDSVLWLGSISGMIKMNTRTEQAVFLNNQSENYIKNIRLNYFMPWRSGQFLVSTSNGIYTIDSNAVIAEHYGTGNGDKIKLPVQSVLYTTWYQHSLWAATPNGLLRIDTALTKTELFTTENGLPDNNIYACLPDNQGNLWLSTNNGLCRFNIETKQVHNYGLADGLPQTEFNTASFLKANTGIFYFGGLNGIIAFDPAKLNKTKDAETPLQLISFTRYSGDSNRIETVMSNQIPNPIVFSSGDRLFNFTFMAPDFRHTNQNRFRYKLQGWADDNWHLFETGNRLSFNSLPPGTYQLLVQVSVAGADWSRETWQTTIRVQAPWYKTAWFYGLSLLTVALVFYAIYRYRLAQIIHIYQIRNRISADMHDEIGSTLSSITFYSQALLMQQQDEKQKAVLEKIKDNAQQVQEGLSDIIWSVKASLDEIENVFARMFRFGSDLLESKGIDFHFEHDETLEHEKLGMTERKNVYLIFKEAINNAAKYAQCKNIRVQISRAHHKIQMTVHDDGKGFNISDIKRGNGLSNMQERAAQMNGELTIHSNGQEGTTVTLLFINKPR